jgi:RNA polymerase subunit RPABC4/transcription elongation factor Spt4
MGLGVGAGLGMMVPGMVRDAMGAGASAPVAAVACSACKGTSPAGAAFCMHCGAKMEAGRACSQCRASVPPGATFCPSCGGKVT